MNCFSICKLCSSNSNKLSMKSPKKKKIILNQVDNDSTYGVIDPQTSITIENNDSNKKLSSLNSPQPSKIINVSFRHKARKVLFGNDRLSQPAIIKENTKDSSKILNRKSLPLFSSKNKRELPKLPVPSINENNTSSNNDGKNLFITSKEIPFDEKANEVYETIYPETDSIVDPFYTKIINDNKNTQKYDYPIFNNNKCKKGNGKEKNQINEDPIYTSASQIYGGSDDAYSSILSNVGGDKENGYAKVTERKNSNDTDSNIPMVDEDLPSSSTVQNPVSINLDSLYAKIKRPTNKEKNKEKNCLETTSKDPIPSSITNNNNKLLQKVDNTTFDSLYQQLDESGSGSIISSYSQNPSYRYITVRETVDVVRERIRRHEEELSRERNNNVNNPGREHYYSTINEYESVGDGNISDNIYDITNSSSTTTNYVNSKNLNINNKLSTPNPMNKIRIIKPKIIPSTTYPSMKQVLLNSNNQSQIKTKSVSMAEIDTLHKNNSNIHTIDIKLTGRKFNENLLESNINLQKTFLSSFDLSWSNQLDNAITFISEILGKETPIENVFDDTFNIGYNIISSSIDKIKDLSDSMIMSKTNFIDNGCQTERISKIPKVLERKKSIDIGTQTYNIQKILNINKNKLSKINKTISKDYVSTIDLSNERSWPLKKE